MANKKKKVTKEEKRAFRFSKLIVLMIIMLNVFFTMGTLYVFYKVGSEPVVLIGSFFAFTTGELFSLALLKLKGD